MFYKILIKNGFFKDSYLLTAKQIEEFEFGEGESLIDTPQPSGTDAFIRPFWNGEKWVESATREELEEIEYKKYIESLKPTEEEIRKAQMELLMLELLIDMEVM